MSKNFELLQQAGISVESEIADFPKRKADFPSIEREAGREQPQAKAGPDRLAGEESLKLVQRIFLAQGARRPRTVVFVGIDRGNGCSRICADAARVLANNVSGSVCLVEANLRWPSLPQFFGVTNHWGLTDALLREDPICGFAQQLHPDNLWLLSCGSLDADSPNLLNSARLKPRLEELRTEFDYVLVDVPPINHYSDAISLGQLADGVAIVLEAHSTRRQSALKAVTTLQAAQIPILGAVLNKRTFPIPEMLYRLL